MKKDFEMHDKENNNINKVNSKDNNEKLLSYYLDSNNFKSKNKKHSNSTEGDEFYLDQYGEHITSRTYLTKLNKNNRSVKTNKIRIKWSSDEEYKLHRLIEICKTDYSMIAEAFEDKSRRQVVNKIKGMRKNEEILLEKLMNSKKKFILDEYNKIKYDLCDEEEEDKENVNVVKNSDNLKKLDKTDVENICNDKIKTKDNLSDKFMDDVLKLL